jgi:hypothetical protein
MNKKDEIVLALSTSASAFLHLLGSAEVSRAALDFSFGTQNISVSLTLPNGEMTTLTLSQRVPDGAL